jgi:hypothetical protein
VPLNVEVVTILEDLHVWQEQRCVKW